MLNTNQNNFSPRDFHTIPYFGYFTEGISHTVPGCRVIDFVLEAKIKIYAPRERIKAGLFSVSNLRGTFLTKGVFSKRSGINLFRHRYFSVYTTSKCSIQHRNFEVTGLRLQGTPRAHFYSLIKSICTNKSATTDIENFLFLKGFD